MHFIVLGSCFASLALISTSQQVSKSTDMTHNNPYLWMLSNQLFHLNTAVQKLEQNLKTLENKLSTLTDRNNRLNKNDKKQQEQIASLFKHCSSNFNIFESRFGSIETKLKKQDSGMEKLQKNCRCNYQKQCQSGWEQHNGHCYYFGKDKFTWHEAKKRCEEMNSYLVKIETNEEHQWIVNTKTTEYPWIGLNDIAHEGKWRWVSDNSPVTYVAWNKGEPNNFGNTNEDCVNYWPSG